MADNAAVSSLKKGLIYVVLPLMSCFGEKDLPQNSESVQQNENVQQVETVIEKQVEAVAENGFWFVSESEYQSGVYYLRPAGDSYGYHLVKIHDETGKLLPETLRSDWYILYKDKDGGWDGSGWYRRSQIDSISEEGVVIDFPYVVIDVSQVVGVKVKNDPYKDKEVMLSVVHILPYLYSTLMSDFRIETHTTDDIHYRGKIITNYTSGHVEVQVRKDFHYIRQERGEHVFTQHLSVQDRVQALGFILLERDHLIMMEDLTIMDE